MFLLLNIAVLNIFLYSSIQCLACLLIVGMYMVSLYFLIGGWVAGIFQTGGFLCWAGIFQAGRFFLCSLTGC